ncbi:CLUMA_CG004704, isoform A [Clunio marinus]|uniref:CLUMA_CG004704, isoform A n=1 Tax=Clunio marinus TaxID=568069 RepID=A0A1J1HSG1_9DIPT|nr:CLUMA_CG004704, isoform A [Clunio marinus]
MNSNNVSLNLKLQTLNEQNTRKEISIISVRKTYNKGSKEISLIELLRLEPEQKDKRGMKEKKEEEFVRFQIFVRMELASTCKTNQWAIDTMLQPYSKLVPTHVRTDTLSKQFMLIFQYSASSFGSLREFCFEYFD